MPSSAPKNPVIRRLGTPRQPNSLEEMQTALADLQSSEMARNRQENLWKSLAKKTADLEKFGKKLRGGIAPQGAVSPVSGS